MISRILANTNNFQDFFIWDCTNPKQGIESMYSNVCLRENK